MDEESETPLGMMEVIRELLMRQPANIRVRSRINIRPDNLVDGVERDDVWSEWEVSVEWKYDANPETK